MWVGGYMQLTRSVAEIPSDGGGNQVNNIHVRDVCVEEPRVVKLGEAHWHVALSSGEDGRARH
jgi:hypothetical protein